MPTSPLIPDLAEQAPPSPRSLPLVVGWILPCCCSPRHRLGPRLRVVHIRHQLQPDSANWAAHCEQRVAGLALPFRVVTVTVDTDEGIEAGARQALYHALFADARHDGATVITAHHRDDQAETLLLRLLRGAGVQGLAAMGALDHRQGTTLWRPLLDLPRSALERNARERGLQWQEDPSNQDQRLRRNYLRHSILPALRQRWRGADEILARTARHMSDASELLDERAQEDADACGVNGQQFPLAGLAALRPARQRNLLRWWLHRQGASAPSAAVLAELLALQVNRKPGQGGVGALGRALVPGALYLLPVRPWHPAGHLVLAAGSAAAITAILATVAHSREGAKADAAARQSDPASLYRCTRLLRNGMHQRIKELWRAAGVPPGSGINGHCLGRDAGISAVGGGGGWRRG